MSQTRTLSKANIKNSTGTLNLAISDYLLPWKKVQNVSIDEREFDRLEFCFKKHPEGTDCLRYV
jgi:hypothetical protein